MTDYYLSSVDGDDGDSGQTWALAKATLQGVIDVGLDGADAIWVKSDHAEALGSATDYNFHNNFSDDPGLTFICVKAVTTNEPPVSADLDIMESANGEGWTTTGNFRFALNGAIFGYGLSFVASDIASNALADIWLGLNASHEDGQIWQSCELGTLSTNTGAQVIIGDSGDSQRYQLIDCKIRFGAPTQELVLNGAALIRNLSHLGSTPTTLFSPRAGNRSSNATIVVENTDINAINPTNIAERVTDGGVDLVLRNCKLPAGVTLVTGASDRWSAIRVDIYNCDSGDTNFRYGRDWNEGTIDTETGSPGITLTGGAEHNGTQYSFKMASSANPTIHTPLESPEFVIFNETVGSSITVTVQLTGSELLQNDDIWMEAQYLGTSGVPLGLSDTNKVALLGSPANLPNAATDWDSDPASVQDMQLVLDFTPQEVGFIHLKVMLAKPSITVYVDPLPVIS